MNKRSGELFLCRHCPAGQCHTSVVYVVTSKPNCYYSCSYCSTCTVLVRSVITWYLTQQILLYNVLFITIFPLYNVTLNIFVYLRPRQQRQYHINEQLSLIFFRLRRYDTPSQLKIRCKLYFSGYPSLEDKVQVSTIGYTIFLPSYPPPLESGIDTR